MAGRRHEDAGSREEFWREQVAGWEKSGQSIRGYCRAQELSEAGFHFWKRELKRREERRVLNRRAMPFAEVHIAAAHEAPIEIVCGTSRRIQVHPGFDEETLVRVIAAVERAGC
jgi:hypothetical protein